MPETAHLPTGLSTGIPIGMPIDESLNRGMRVTVVIDGMAAAGKSTLAAQLEKHYTAGICNVIPMDHFFLRQQQKTPQRLAQPGGNIDYERFETEVFQPLKTDEAFSYRPYDCSAQKLSEPVCITPKQLTIIEGVYSFLCAGDIADISVFMHIDEQMQRKRLLARSPALYERFISEWLPMETAYFKHYSLQDKCDYILKGDINVIYTDN